LLGLLASSVATGRWSGPFGFIVLMFNSNGNAFLTLLLPFVWFLYRRDTVAFAAYRTMAFADEQRPPFARRAVGGLAALASPAFALLLAAYLIRGAYVTVPAFEFPVLKRQNRPAPLTGLIWEDGEEQREGQRLTLANQHREAAAVYRQALERHERRADEFPNRTIYLHLLAI
jgi:hypothetical protein